MRQSPISSRNRSMTIVRSVGSVPVAARSSSMNAARLSAAQGSSRYRVCSSFLASVVVMLPISRMKAPTARPSSRGRPGASPCQNGIAAAASPGAGVTITRSWVISSIFQEVEPSTKTSPGRLS